MVARHPTWLMNCLFSTYSGMRSRSAEPAGDCRPTVSPYCEGCIYRQLDAPSMISPAQVVMKQSWVVAPWPADI